jgi:hypothetical protein
MKKNKILILIILLSIFYVEQVIAQCDFIDAKTGNHYVGECKTKTENNKVVRYPDGQGTQINSDGSSFVGIFSTGNRVSGTYYFDNAKRNGSRIENAVYENDNLKSGIYYFSSGAKYEGVFKNDKFEGENCAYYYKPSSDKISYVGDFSHGKFNGQGTLTYKNNTQDIGLWKDDVFLGAKIGTYQERDVLKKGDTIVTFNNRYLLSQQAIIEQGDEVYGFIPANSFLVEKDMTGKTLPIGYITANGTSANSTRLYGGVAQYAKNSTGHKFNEFICDKATYDKFINYCNWEICRMENTKNANTLSYAEYDEMIKNDRALNSRILNAKLSEILVQLFGDFTSDKLAKSFAGFDLNTSLQDWTIKTVWDEATQLQEITGVSGDCFSSMTSAISSLQKNPGLETATVADFMKSNSKEQDLYTTETYRTFKRFWVSALDVVGDCDKSGAIKKNILYHLLKNAPSGGEAIGLYAANVSIKFSIAPEFKQSLNAQIQKAQQKKQFLEGYKAQYSNLIEKNTTNCLEFTRVINKLRSECANPFGQIYQQEALSKMQKYVFGNDKIGVCNVLSKEELKPKINQPQTQLSIDPKEKNIIGYYGNIPVYKFNDSIIVGEKVYLLSLQPSQQAFSNKFTKFRGNIKMRYFIMYDGKTLPEEKDFLNKNIIGWIDYDYKNTYSFTQQKNDRIEGLNLFGSLYIGPNNPIYPSGKTIYTLPYQDQVDLAALEHDICYDKRGAAGASDAIFNTGVVECDLELVMSCFATLQIKVENNATQSAIDYIKYTLDWNDNLINDITDHEQVISPAKRAKYVAVFFLGTSSGKGWGLIFKNYVNYSETEFQKSNPDANLTNPVEKQADATLSKQTITYTAQTLLVSASDNLDRFRTEAGDTFIGTIKDGKIVEGTVYRNNEPVKTFIQKRR